MSMLIITLYMCVIITLYVCMCACVRACMRACVYTSLSIKTKLTCTKSVSKCESFLVKTKVAQPSHVTAVCVGVCVCVCVCVVNH